MSVNENKNNEGLSLPTSEQLADELSRVSTKNPFKRIIKNAIQTAIVVAAIVVLINTMLLPVMRIEGNSMSPTIEDKSIVVALKIPQLVSRGDVCCFYYDNNILCKRVIAVGGDVVRIEENGDVFVNDEQLNEPYVNMLSLGECDIEFPYTVPDNAYFVLGDNRPTSLDSRSSEIGCIPQEKVIGKLILDFWPVSDFKIIK